MRRFAKIEPRETVHEIQARHLDPQALKRAWIEMSDEADAKITHLADTPARHSHRRRLRGRRRQAPDGPATHPDLTIHHPRIRGCLPRVDGLEPEIPHG